MPFPCGQFRDVLAGAALAALLSSPALAQGQLVTKFTSYMHSGPGLQFSVTDEIPNRTPLTPEICQGGWCRVRYGGGQPGWIEQSLLTNQPSTAQPPPGARPVECTDFARTGWPDQGNLERVCTFAPNKPIELGKPAG